MQSNSKHNQQVEPVETPEEIQIEVWKLDAALDIIENTKLNWDTAQHFAAIAHDKTDAIQYPCLRTCMNFMEYMHGSTIDELLQGRM